MFDDPGYRVDFVYDTTNKPLEYSFFAPKNWMESEEIFKGTKNRVVTEADRQNYFATDNRSVNAQNVRKPGVFYDPAYPQFNRYIFGAVPTENVEPSVPIQYVADKDQGHTTTTDDEGNTVQNEGVTRV